MGAGLSDEKLVAVLSEYLGILQQHRPAEEMMDLILTSDFETGFIGGHLWEGLDGLRDFLSQREGFFDERHVIDELLEREDDGDEVRARTRLHFFLRRWEAPSPVSEEFTGSASTGGVSATRTAGGAWQLSSWRGSRT